MKLLLGYSIWNKVDMMAWLLHGIALNFDPATTNVAFHFDACEDGSQDAWNACYPYLLMRAGGWKQEQITGLASPTTVGELGGHNRILDLFMAGNYDLCLIAQDDQRFTACPAHFLEVQLNQFGERLGIIGGRDGYDVAYSHFTGSRWSESNVQRRLNHGEFVPLPYMNSGPIAYTRKVVERVGKLDPEFIAYYVWDDYGHRARKLGFVNGVMGMDLIHAKFGRVKASVQSFIGGQAAAHDLALRARKHGF